MKIIQKKYTIKIPNNISIFYSEQKQIIIVVGSLKTISLKLKVKISLLQKEKMILVHPISFSKISKNQQKQIKTLQGTTTALTKHVLIESSNFLYEKLKLIGVGFRVYDVEMFKNQLFSFKLGFSHPIYYKTPNNLNIFCLKFTKLFLFGNSYCKLTQTAASIRKCKVPEPYKGKGILYDNEKITIKEGKKA